MRHNVFASVQLPVGPKDGSTDFVQLGQDPLAEETAFLPGSALRIIDCDRNARQNCDFPEAVRL